MANVRPADGLGSACVRGAIVMSLHAVSRRAAVKTGAAAAVGLVLGRSRHADAQGTQALPAITKPIPSTGEPVPVIGLGTNAYSASTEEQMAPLREVLERMPQIGGRLIDTARAYGRSEAVIGQLVEGLGNRTALFIATKTPIGGDFSNPQAVFDASFTALRTDTIDLMQTHQMAGVAAMMPVFEQAKAAGRIRYIGMSTSEDNQYEAMMAAMRTYPLDFIQVDYSVANRNAAEGVLALAQERRIAVLINMPFGGRGRGAATMFSRVSGRPLPDWAAEFDAASWAQVFLKYIVSHPAVTAAIPGTTQRRNLEDNQGAGRGRLADAAMRRRIEQYWDALA
jgi:diketogulonate reductase-like aldo/keto reductase